MEVVTTHTEAEALLLEANLIKRLKPRFNIVLRDDKSYPWLMLTEDHPFPQIAKHRGAQTRKGSYWGPFASAWAVNQTVTAMQRVFLLRSCADTVFANRTRPCLLYQIRRCSAPCVGRIERGRLRRAGRARRRPSWPASAATVQQELAAEMEHAAEALEFERAAAVRDRIRAPDLRAGQRRGQPGQPDGRRRDRRLADRRPDLRAGVLRPRRPQQRQPRLLPDATPATRKRPRCSAPSSPSSTTTSRRRRCVLVNHALPEQELVAEALSLKAGRKVEIAGAAARREARRGGSTPRLNAREALERKLAESRRPGEAAGRRRAGCSTCPRRPSASRSTTTATSWAPTPTA